MQGWPIGRRRGGAVRRGWIGVEPRDLSAELADSLNLFRTGSLAPGVMITDSDYMVYSVDAGMKFRGFFLQTEFYKPTLDGFKAHGILPVCEIDDWGFYVQSSFFPIPKMLELYAATS